MGIAGRNEEKLRRILSSKVGAAELQVSRSARTGNPICVRGAMRRPIPV